MTDSEMKKIFEDLLRDENDLNDIEIAVTMLTVMAMDKYDELAKVFSPSKPWISER